RARLAEPAPGHQQPHGPLAPRVRRSRLALPAVRLPAPVLDQRAADRRRQPTEEMRPRPLVRPAPLGRLAQKPLDLGGARIGHPAVRPEPRRSANPFSRFVSALTTSSLEAARAVV